MKVSLVVGGVEVTLSGADLTLRQVKELMRSAASIALALPRDADPVLEPERGQPVGFTANLDLDPARHEPHGPDWYDGEE